MLMPPLIDKWNYLKDEDKDLFPLLEVKKKKKKAHILFTALKFFVLFVNGFAFFLETYLFKTFLSLMCTKTLKSLLYL